MTDIEKKALALLNEACKSDFKDIGSTYRNNILDALFLSIEQHEAFRQEVSDAVTGFDEYGTEAAWERLSRFIIAKPDPLVEVINDADDMVRKPDAPSYAEAIRAALAARGLEVRKIGEGE